MRIVYLDIDTLRPDHLGCYGYHRATSPNIDELARRGIQFEQVYASDTPCLPSRSALVTGQFGIHNGAVNHGGRRAQLFADPPDRGFESRLVEESWVGAIQAAGFYTTTISSFHERHAAWHWVAGYREVINPGARGLDLADDISAPAIEWLERNGRQDNWFLHLHFWDPHIPYRTPKEYGEPFIDSPLPEWLTEEVRGAHWGMPGPNSAQEIPGYELSPFWFGEVEFPRQPIQAASMDDVRAMFDGYDTGILYADDHVGRVLSMLDSLGVLEETAFLLASDHGENLGELGIYGDHQFADEYTSHIPALLVWPGLAPSKDNRLHYHIDLAATLLELLGVDVPSSWDGVGFATALQNGTSVGRDHLVLSQLAWAAQRAVRVDRWLYIRTYHDAWHGLPTELLFDLSSDQHEQTDLSAERPDVVQRCRAILGTWHDDQMLDSSNIVDPLWEVMGEGGPWHARIVGPDYWDRLRATGRGEWLRHFDVV